MKITEHNADPTSTFTMSVNEFSDKTLEEQLNSFGLSRPLKFVKSDNPEKPSQSILKGNKLGAIPASVDWRV